MSFDNRSARPLPKLGPASLRGPVFPSVSTHPGADHARNVARAARENSGDWVEFRIRMDRKAAQVKASTLRLRPPVVFRPAGAYEVCVEKRPDGYALLVRFVGWPQMTPP